MSIITTPVLFKLWTDAQRHPEWATTRFWEYFLNRIVFNQDEWVVSSQQPPSHVPRVGRRVDLVVEHIDPATGISSTVLFVEMKRAGVSQTELIGCEHQAFTAGCEYSIDTNLSRVWAMTCFGSQARLWIVEKNREYLIPYFPITHGKAERAEYVEVSEQGGIQLLHCLNYIKSHPYPPSDVVEQLLASSSSDDSSYAIDDSSNEPESPEASSAAPAPAMDPFTLHGGDTAMAGGSGDGTAPYPYLDPMTQDWDEVVGDTPAAADVAGIGAEAEAEEQAWIMDAQRMAEHTTNQSSSHNQPAPFGETGGIQYTQSEDAFNTQATGTASTTGTHAWPVEASSSTFATSTGNWVEVRVRLETHTFGSDQYIFRDSGNQRVSTTKHDWKRGTYDGQPVNKHKRGGTTYYTRQKIL